MFTHLSLDECETLARKIWYGQDWRGFHRQGGQKWTSMPIVNINGDTTVFPFPSGTWASLATYEMLVAYPKWDFPGTITVRRLS